MSRSEIVKLTADAEVNTDINAYAEVRQSKLFYRGVKEEDKPQTFFAQHYTGDLSRVISKDISKDQDFYYKLLKSMQQQQKSEKFFSLLKQVENLFSHDLNFSTRLSYLYLNAQRYASAEKVLKRALEESGDKDDLKEFQQHYLAVLYESKRFKDLSDFAASEVIAPSPLSECYIAAADAQNGHLTSAMIRKVTDVSRTNGYLEQCGDFYPKLMGLIYYKLGDYDMAIFYLEQTYAKYGQDVDVVRQLLSSYIETKSITNAEMFAEYYPTVLRGYRDQLSYYENRFRSEGLAEDADILKNLREQYQ